MLGEEREGPWARIGNALANAAAGAITAAGNIASQQITASTSVRPPVTPKPAAPKLSYLIPLGIAGAAGVAAIALTIKKKRRR